MTKSAVSQISDLKIEYRAIDSLKMNASNPRRHHKTQIGKLAKSLQTFGFIVPVLVDPALQLVAGHGRILAAKSIGLKRVPTCSIEHLTAAQLQAFTIADNRLTDLSEWDDQTLAEELKRLSDLELNFEINVTGFDVGEIDFRIESLGSNSSRAECEPIPPPGPAVTRPGDLWQLGGHRVLCGNALESDSYVTLMGREKAAMVFVDPPYNVKIDGHATGLGAVRHREFAMACGEMSKAEFTDFLKRSFTLLAQNCSDGALSYVCMDWRHSYEILCAAQSLYDLQNICVWSKDNAGMGSLYRSQHELIFVFKSGKGRHRNNVQLGRFGRSRSNVWRYSGTNRLGTTSEEEQLTQNHPTVKPVRLIADAILDVTARGDIVLDAFCGSGSTVLAAERTGRSCRAVEIDPLFVDLIVRRWQLYTGENARNTRTGASFNASESGTEKCSAKKATTSAMANRRGIRNSKRAPPEIKRDAPRDRKTLRHFLKVNSQSKLRSRKMVSAKEFQSEKES